MAPDLLTLGGRLAWLRQDHGQKRKRRLSLVELSRNLNARYNVTISKSRLGELEKLDAPGSTGAVRPEHLRALAAYYGVDIDWLMAGPPELGKIQPEYDSPGVSDSDLDTFREFLKLDDDRKALAAQMISQLLQDQKRLKALQSAVDSAMSVLQPLQSIHQQHSEQSTQEDPTNKSSAGRSDGSET